MTRQRDGTSPNRVTRGAHARRDGRRRLDEIAKTLLSTDTGQSAIVDLIIVRDFVRCGDQPDEATADRLVEAIDAKLEPGAIETRKAFRRKPRKFARKLASLPACLRSDSTMRDRA